MRGNWRLSSQPESIRKKGRPSAALLHLTNMQLLRLFNRVYLEYLRSEKVPL